MKKVKVNVHELAKMIIENADAQLSDCCIGVNDSGDLYFYNSTEASTGWIGDDVIVFSFQSCDMDMGNPKNPDDIKGMADWLITDYESESNSDNYNQNFIVELVDERN